MSDNQITSTIILAEEVENLEKHRLANSTYFPCYIKVSEDSTVPALFTKHELDNAMTRAKKNPEDIGEYEDDSSWLANIFGY